MRGERGWGLFSNRGTARAELVGDVFFCFHSAYKVQGKFLPFSCSVISVWPRGPGLSVRLRILELSVREVLLIGVAVRGVDQFTGGLVCFCGGDEGGRIMGRIGRRRPAG